MQKKNVLGTFVAFFPVIGDVIAEKKHKVGGSGAGGKKKEPGSGFQREKDSPERG